MFSSTIIQFLIKLISDSVELIFLYLGNCTNIIIRYQRFVPIMTWDKLNGTALNDMRNSKKVHCDNTWNVFKHCMLFKHHLVKPGWGSDYVGFYSLSKLRCENIINAEESQVELRWWFLQKKTQLPEKEGDHLHSPHCPLCPCPPSLLHFSSQRLIFLSALYPAGTALSLMLGSPIVTIFN